MNSTTGGDKNEGSYFLTYDSHDASFTVYYFVFCGFERYENLKKVAGYNWTEVGGENGENS